MGYTTDSTDQGVARYIERFSPNTISAVLVGVAGLTFLLKAGGGLYWLIPAAVASLLGGVVNAWLFLSFPCQGDQLVSHVLRVNTVKGRLPDEGPVRIGPVGLPPGRLITGWRGNGHHVAWATVDPVPGSGQVWEALAELHPQTGLVPIQLDGLLGGLPHDGLPDDALRPWDSGEFIPPEDPRNADSVDAGAFLSSEWRRWVPPPDEDDPEWIETMGPFTREWPGLASSERTLLTPAERRYALDVVLPLKRAELAAPGSRIGLVVADRPADVLAVIGWDSLEPRGQSLLPLTAVLRSWEDRFGARLIDVGFDDLRLLVERPPRTLEAAQRLAAEQVVLADDCIDGARDIPDIAARLLDGPVWTFWWD